MWVSRYAACAVGGLFRDSRKPQSDALQWLNYRAGAYRGLLGQPWHSHRASRALCRMAARRLPNRVTSRAVVTTEGEPVMPYISGTLMYWNTHSGFGEIELDNEDG